MPTKRSVPPLRELNPPARCTILYDPAQVTSDLVKVVTDALCFLQEMLQTLARSHRDVGLECGILSKVLYNCTSGHHMQKYFHGLKKIEKCLKHYIEMNLPAVIEEFGDTIPSGPGVGEALRLPSRQMLEFVLVRLRDAACLLCRTNSYTMQTFILVKQQMVMGLFVPKMVLFEGLLSRIWMYSRAMVTCLHTWYKDLTELKNHVKASQADWLPLGYELPASLEEDIRWPPTHDSLAMEQMAASAQTDGSLTPVETTLQRYCSRSLAHTVDDDSLLGCEPVEEYAGVTVEDMGQPVLRETPDTHQPHASPANTSSMRRHWLTRLKSCTDVKNMLATLEALMEAIPGLDNSEVVRSTRSGLVELLDALKSSGKQYKKKRKLITKTSRKVLYVVVKKAYPKKTVKKRKT